MMAFGEEDLESTGERKRERYDVQLKQTVNVVIKSETIRTSLNRK